MDTKAVHAGMNDLACPACQELNKISRSQSYCGTMFVPVTMRKMAQLRAGHVERVRGRCHEGHSVELQIRG